MSKIGDQTTGNNDLELAIQSRKGQVRKIKILAHSFQQQELI